MWQQHRRHHLFRLIRHPPGRTSPRLAARATELDRAITDMGCDPDDAEQFRSLSVILLNAHFKPHYQPDWIVQEPPKWTVRLDALLVQDVWEEMRENPKLQIQSACKKLLTRGRKKGAGLWRGMYGTGLQNLRKRYRIAVRNPKVLAYFEADQQKLLNGLQQSIEMIKQFMRDRRSPPNEPSLGNKAKGQMPTPNAKSSKSKAKAKR
jgi:hypothetical protein